MFKKIVFIIGAIAILASVGMSQANQGTQAYDKARYSGNVVRDSAHYAQVLAWIDSIAKNIYNVSAQHPLPIQTPSGDTLIVKGATTTTHAAGDTVPSRSTVYWKPFRVQASFTRPVDTVSYNGTLYQVISNSKTQTASTLLGISGCAAQNGGTGYIGNITIVGDSANATNLAIRARVCSDSAGLPQMADGAPYRLTDSSTSKFLGIADLYFDNVGAGVGSRAVRKTVSFDTPVYFVCAAGSTSLYVRLIDISQSGLWKPGAGEKFTVILEGQQLVQQ